MIALSRSAIMPSPLQAPMSALSSASDRTGTSAMPGVLIFIPSMMLAVRVSCASHPKKLRRSWKAEKTVTGLSRFRMAVMWRSISRRVIVSGSRSGYALASRSTLLLRVLTLFGDCPSAVLAYS